MTLYVAQIYRDRSVNRRQRWRFRIVASNGRIVEASEPYFSVWNCKRAVRRRYPDVTIRRVEQ
jgi:uncharacterized protein YegP (UPF0339 family)